MLVPVIDYRVYQNDPPVEGRTQRRKLQHGKVVRRDPATVDGVTLHQTACLFGPANDPVKRHERAMTAGCHVMAFRDIVAIANPLTWYVYHGNRLNRHTLGLEIEGHFAGTPDNPSTPVDEEERTTWGGHPMHLEGLSLACAQEALRLLVTMGRGEGMPIKYLYAHRQSSAARRSDPGYEIWQKVGIEVGVKELGLVPRYDWIVEDGRKIPSAWDEKATARY